MFIVYCFFLPWILSLFRVNQAHLHINTAHIYLKASVPHLKVANVSIERLTFAKSSAVLIILLMSKHPEATWVKRFILEGFFNHQLFIDVPSQAGAPLHDGDPLKNARLRVCGVAFQHPFIHAVPAVRHNAKLVV